MRQVIGRWPGPTGKHLRCGQKTLQTFAGTVGAAMKFTLSWLKDHLETDAALEEIVETLTKTGLEVERVDNKASALKGFVIASIVEAKPHPNADRLRLCFVDTGEGAPVQVVCGAPNARTGMKSVFASPGTYIPGKKTTLGKGVIRGVESN